MNKIYWLLLFFVFLLGCNISPDQNEGRVITISGDIHPDAMGMTLVHEHILVDFIGADSTGFHRWDREEVMDFLIPYIEEVQKKGVKTIIECTPSFLGKDPKLLEMISNKTGIQFLTNTGYYGAVAGKYLPKEVQTLSAEALAKLWIGEYNNGIDGTGIKPGFIKIGVNEGEILSALDSKLVHAAALAHQKTGLLIVSHTGTWKTAKAQIDILKQYGIDLQYFVWVHAQNEPDFQNYHLADKEGVWVSLDGIVWDVEGHLQRLKYFKDKLGLERVLVSHDAGWFTPGEEAQSGFKGYTALFDELIPKLRQEGFTQSDLDLLLINNPKKAFMLPKE